MHLTRKLTLALATFLALAGTAAPAAAAAEGPCTDADGVTVVVDFTDLGGEVEVGCATDPATGTEALQAAGFVDTRDDSGLICAIDAQPDPCPAEFTGSYWSYWHAEQGGEWETYMEGSDTAVPAAGAVEGWRYSDGTAGPTAMTATSTGATESAAPTETAEPSESAEATETADSAEPAETAETTDAAQDGSSSGTIGWVVGGLVLVALAGVIAVVVRRRGSDA